jgi:hypothetical protein
MFDLFTKNPQCREQCLAINRDPIVAGEWGGPTFLRRTLEISMGLEEWLLFSFTMRKTQNYKLSLEPVGFSPLFLQH